MKARFAILMMLFALAASAGAARENYVGPAAAGSGDGSAAANAALYNSSTFWAGVKTAVQTEPGTVHFLQGEYTPVNLTLNTFGNDNHVLTLEGDPAGGTLFSFKTGVTNTEIMLAICRNMVVRNLNFSGPATVDYCLRLRRCSRILVERCRFVDLPNVTYGSTGAHYADSTDITYKECEFTRIGTGGGAHMIYNAYGSSDIKLIDSHFEDCAGEYVRFRGGTDYGTVRGCTFKSTGTWPAGAPVHQPFLAVPAFNDVNPGDEWLGTHFTIENNSFEYAPVAVGGSRTMLYFRFVGYNPTGYDYLLNPQEGAILESGSAAERRALLWTKMKLDPSQIHLKDNSTVNVASMVLFTSYASYGAVSDGWSNVVSIYDLVDEVRSATSDWSLYR